MFESLIENIFVYCRLCRLLTTIDFYLKKMSVWNIYQRYKPVKKFLLFLNVRHAKKRNVLKTLFLCINKCNIFNKNNIRAVFYLKLLELCKSTSL